MLTIAIDTEFNPSEKKPFIVTMSEEEHEGFLFYPALQSDYYIIKSICEDTDIRKIFHSATTDIHVLQNIGIYVVPPYDDTFILASILDENYKSKRLKTLMKEKFGVEIQSATKLKAVKKKYKNWSDIPKDIIEPYAIDDAIYTIRLYNHYRKKILSQHKLYQIEKKLIPVIVKMQQKGHKIDRVFCHNEKKRLSDIWTYYYKKLCDISGELVCISSPKTLTPILEKQDIPDISYTKTGLVKTDFATLSKYIKTNDFIKYLLICRNIDKQISTYYNSLLSFYTSVNCDIAHFMFYQSGTKSGRFSADLVQTIPRNSSSGLVDNNTRKAFIPREGFINFYFDYKQIEMRLFAHFTNNNILIDGILKGIDTHTSTAQTIFKEEWYNPETSLSRKKQLRIYAKTINFLLIYGGGTELLAQQLGVENHIASQYLKMYDQKFHIREYIRYISNILYKKKELRVPWIGRIYRVPLKLAYKGLNLIVQGSAAYIIKLAMLRLNDYLIDYPRINILLQIHDELVIEVPFNSDLSVIEEIKNIIEDRDTFKVPITCSVSYTTKSWLEKKEWN